MDRWPPFLFIAVPHFVFESEIFADPIFFRFICFAMERTYKHDYSQTFCFNGKTVILEMGEFIFGRMHWANELNISEDKVRRLLDRLISQQWTAKVASKTTSKMTVYKWLWTNFPQPSRRQNRQQKAGMEPPDPPQTKNKNIEKETTAREASSNMLPASVAASFTLDAAAKSLLAPLPLEEQVAVLALLNHSKGTNTIKNEMGWLRKCIEGGWYKTNHAPHQAVSSLESNKALANALCQWLDGKTHFRFHMYQDIFEICKENESFQFFYYEDGDIFKSKLISVIKKLGLDPPSHIFQ